MMPFDRPITHRPPHEDERRSEQQPDLPESLPVSAVPAPGLRVLIIEDNSDVADMLADLIGAWGCETRVANTAQAGLNAGEEWRPEVVLLDIGLPDLHGWEVARRVRQGSWGRDALLVTITAWGRVDDRRRSTAVGIDHHLLKPVDSRALWRILTAVQPRR